MSLNFDENKKLLKHRSVSPNFGENKNLVKHQSVFPNFGENKNLVKHRSLSPNFGENKNLVKHRSVSPNLGENKNLIRHRSVSPKFGGRKNLVIQATIALSVEPPREHRNNNIPVCPGEHLNRLINFLYRSLVSGTFISILACQESIFQEKKSFTTWSFDKYFIESSVMYFDFFSRSPEVICK